MFTLSCAHRVTFWTPVLFTLLCFFTLSVLCLLGPISNPYPVHFAMFTLSCVRRIPFPTPVLFTLKCFHCPVFTVPFPTCCAHTDRPVSMIPFPTPVLLLCLHWLSCVHSPIFHPCPVAVFTLTVLCPTVPFSTPVLLLCLHWLSCVHSPIFHPCPVAVFTLTVLCPQSHFPPLSCCCVYTDCPVSAVPFSTPVLLLCLHWLSCVHSPISNLLCLHWLSCVHSPISNLLCLHWLSCVHSPITNLLCLHWLSCVHSPIFNPCPVAVFTRTVLCPQSHFQPLSCCCVYTDCPVSTVPFPTCCVYTDCPVSTVPFSTPVLLLYLHWLSCIHSPIFNPFPVRHYSSLPLPLPLLASSLCYLLLSPSFSKRFYLKHYAASFLTLVTHSVFLHYFPIIMWFIFPSKLAQKLKPLRPTTIHTSGVSLLQRFLCLLCQG